MLTIDWDWEVGIWHYYSWCVFFISVTTKPWKPTRPSRMVVFTLTDCNYSKLRMGSLRIPGMDGQCHTGRNQDLSLLSRRSRMPVVVSPPGSRKTQDFPFLMSWSVWLISCPSLFCEKVLRAFPPLLGHPRQPSDKYLGEWREDWLCIGWPAVKLCFNKVYLVSWFSKTSKD